MSENNFEHGFNWMRPYLACSVACEFDLLRTDAERATDTYSEAYKKKYPHGHDLFECKPGEEDNCFVVSRTDKDFPKADSSVVFTSKGRHIEVAVKKATNSVLNRKITLTLNEEEGQCRYQIDGKVNTCAGRCLSLCWLTSCSQVLCKSKTRRLNAAAVKKTRARKLESGDPFIGLTLSGAVYGDATGRQLREDHEMGKEDKMKKPTEEDDFEWVEALHNCSAAGAFEALNEIVKDNVKTRKKQLDEDAGAKLTSENDSHSRFKVSSGDKGVTFRLKKDHIAVQYDEETADDINFTATPSKNGDWGVQIQGSR